MMLIWATLQRTRTFRVGQFSHFVKPFIDLGSLAVELQVRELNNKAKDVRHEQDNQKVYLVHRLACGLLLLTTW